MMGEVGSGQSTYWSVAMCLTTAIWCTWAVCKTLRESVSQICRCAETAGVAARSELRILGREVSGIGRKPAESSPGTSSSSAAGTPAQHQATAPQGTPPGEPPQNGPAPRLRVPQNYDHGRNFGLLAEGEANIGENTQRDWGLRD
ncbi:unnamed protein product [Amoebophrya sp. A120]|nr:unnamed protein product [Amoebophrya sp. A120]|eukprot:GSA120T00020566001.1